MERKRWKEVPLHSLLEGGIRNGFSPLESQEWTGVQMLGLGCLTADGFQPRQLKNAPSSVSPQHPAILRDGDLLISRANTRNLVGLAGIYRDTGTPCIYPDLMMRLRPSGACIPEYLEVVLRSPTLRQQITGRAQGTSESMVKISAEMIRSLPVPLPSLDQQQHIVNVLSAVDEHISIESLATLKEIAIWDAVANDQVGDHARRFGTVHLKEVCERGGEYGSNSPAVPSSDQLPRYVRITDIDQHGNLSKDLSSAVSVPWEQARPYLLQDGDLLIARTGYTTGKSYLYREGDGLCAFAGYLVRYRLDQSRMLPAYAFMWTRANAFKQWVSQNVREVGQRNISAREYNQHRLPVPPLEMQHELVSAWQEARATFQLRQQQIDRLLTLKQALADDLLRGATR
ncbi:restriction endonuclease subunit S [Streptomyces sp. NPDC001415]